MIEVVKETMERPAKTPELTMLNISVDELGEGRPLRAMLDKFCQRVEEVGDPEESNTFFSGWEENTSSLHYMLFKTNQIKQTSVQLLFDCDDLVGISTFSVHGDLMVAPRRIYSLKKYRGKWLFGHYVMPFLLEEGRKRQLTYWVQLFNDTPKNRTKFILHHDLRHRHARWYVPPFLFKYRFEAVSPLSFKAFGVQQFGSYYRFRDAPPLTPAMVQEKIK